MAGKIRSGYDCYRASEWLESNTKAADQAIRFEQDGHVTSLGNQNRELLAAMVEATRVSTTMAAESASRCKAEQQTLLDLRAKLQDIEFCKLRQEGSTKVAQTRWWHVLGECQSTPRLTRRRKKEGGKGDSRDSAGASYSSRGSRAERAGSLIGRASLRHNQGGPVDLASIRARGECQSWLAGITLVGLMGPQAHGRMGGRIPRGAQGSS